MLNYATPHTERVLRDVALERIKQVNLGYTTEHDIDHGPTGLIQMAEDYAQDAVMERWAVDQGRGSVLDERRMLIAAIGLLVAAVEVLDVER